MWWSSAASDRPAFVLVETTPQGATTDVLYIYNAMGLPYQHQGQSVILARAKCPMAAAHAVRVACDMGWHYRARSLHTYGDGEAARDLWAEAAQRAQLPVQLQDDRPRLSQVLRDITHQAATLQRLAFQEATQPGATSPAAALQVWRSILQPDSG